MFPLDGITMERNNTSGTQEVASARNPRERRVENDTFNASELNSWNLSRQSGGQPKTENLSVFSPTLLTAPSWISSKRQKKKKGGTYCRS